MDEGLQSCISVKPVAFQKEAQVRQECVDHYKKQIEDIHRNPPSICFFKRNADGLFEKSDLQYIAEHSMRAFGRDYHKLSEADKKSFLEKLKAQRDFQRIKDKLGLDDHS